MGTFAAPTVFADRSISQEALSTMQEQLTSSAKARCIRDDTAHIRNICSVVDALPVPGSGLLSIGVQLWDLEVAAPDPEVVAEHDTNDSAQENRVGREIGLTSRQHGL